MTQNASVSTKKKCYHRKRFNFYSKGFRVKFTWNEQQKSFKYGSRLLFTASLKFQILMPWELLVTRNLELNLKLENKPKLKLLSFLMNNKIFKSAHTSTKLARCHKKVEVRFVYMSLSQNPIFCCTENNQFTFQVAVSVQ